MLHHVQQIVAELAASERTGAKLRKRAMELLSNLPGYDWCGVYRLEGETLILDEYVGVSTEHGRIPVGSGVCGTAVAENRNQIVDDVQGLENYLSCSLETRSEIVVLIRDRDLILGQIDIDSHSPSAFGPDDERLLRAIAAILAQAWA
ncbi:MAG: GAF domain-containing protein [Fimbriimonadales bacterium]